MLFILYLCLVINRSIAKNDVSYYSQRHLLQYNEKVIHKFTLNKSAEETTAINFDTINMPVNFNAAKKWGQICPSIMEIKNQGRCRSGWAIAIADTTTDRRCIFYDGEPELPLSAMMLLTCCPNCCGCGGGDILNAWKFVRDMGLLSGSMNSDYHLQPDDGCQPYLIKPLSKKDILKSSTQCLQTPPCIKTKCTNPSYVPVVGDNTPLNFKIDDFKVMSRFKQEDIMRELIKNGPLQVSFHLYEDFKEYKRIDDNICPIYIHTWGKREGDHSAKLIGWGTENDRKYWLVINSFGPYWGCNGTIKISRDGNDNMDFGYAVVAPSMKNDYENNGYNGMTVITISNFYWTLIISFFFIFN